VKSTTAVGAGWSPLGGSRLLPIAVSLDSEIGVTKPAGGASYRGLAVHVESIRCRRPTASRDHRPESRSFAAELLWSRTYVSQFVHSELRRNPGVGGHGKMLALACPETVHRKTVAPWKKPFTLGLA
jgi:hypothetical protein